MTKEHSGNTQQFLCRSVPITGRVPIYVSAATGHDAYVGEYHREQLHYHECAQVICSRKGSCLVHCEDKTYTLSERDALLIMPYSPHLLTPIEGEERFEADHIYFDDSKLYDYAACLMFFDSVPKLNKLPMRMLPIKYSDHPDVFRMLYETIKEKRRATQESEQLSIIFLLAFLIRLTHCLPEEYKQIGNTEFLAEIKPALTYIQQYYTEHIPIDMLSELCNMSITNLRRKFKLITGYTPLNYINRLRVEKSCMLLSGTNQSMTEVANNSGFDSISSFNRQFFSIIGLSPQKWRNEQNRLDSSKHEE